MAADTCKIRREKFDDAVRTFIGPAFRQQIQDVIGEDRFNLLVDYIYAQMSADRAWHETRMRWSMRYVGQNFRQLDNLWAMLNNEHVTEAWQASREYQTWLDSQRQQQRDDADDEARVHDAQEAMHYHWQCANDKAEELCKHGYPVPLIREPDAWRELPERVEVADAKTCDAVLQRALHDPTLVAQKMAQALGRKKQMLNLRADGAREFVAFFAGQPGGADLLRDYYRNADEAIAWSKGKAAVDAAKMEDA